MVHDALALYGVQVCRKALPLIIVPFLARILRPAGWGLVAFMQALGDFLVLAIEFGFSFSGTREIARFRDDPPKCGEIMTGVLSAQILLAVGSVLCAIGVAFLIPILHAHPRLVAAGLCYAVAQGFMPLWFFQGLERMKLCAALEVAGKVIGCTCIFLFVRSPADDWKVLGFQALAPGIMSVLGLALAFRTIPWVRPRLDLLQSAFRQSWPMFLLRSGESLYSVCNSFVLGLFVAPVYVGYFAGADKITRAAFGLLIPIRDVLFPRMSHLASSSMDRARQLARSGMVVMAAGGVLLAAVQWVFAPLLIRLLMGPGFEPSVSVMRIEAAYPILVAVTCSLGMQWLVPLGYDKLVCRITLMAGAINLTLATILAPQFAHIGMAWAVISAETFVSVSFLVTVSRTNPLWGKTCTEAQIGEVSASHFSDIHSRIHEEA